jgi:uncharacterized protein YndB with AHSA1/START domain
MPMLTDRIEKKIHLRANRDRIWHALANAQKFGSWFGMRFDEDFAPGKTVRAVLASSSVDPDGAKIAAEYANLTLPFMVERMERPRMFSFRWHPYAIDRGVDYSSEPTTLVAFELEEATDGTLLTVSETGFDHIPAARRATAFSANEGGWAIQIRRLEQYLAAPL